MMMMTTGHDACHIPRLPFSHSIVSFLAYHHMQLGGHRSLVIALERLCILLAGSRTVSLRQPSSVAAPFVIKLGGNDGCSCRDKSTTIDDGSDDR